MSAIAGLRVTVSPDIPKMKLAQGDYVTPEFRAEIDEWLRDFFGVTNLIEDGQSLVSEAMGMVWMNPRTYANFRILT